MIRESTVALLLLTSFLLSGCDSSVNTERAGVNTGGSEREIGSMSGTEDIGGYLEESSWSSIELDLDRYLYDREGAKKSYKISMDFKDGKVSALADCFEITARYRVSGDEVIFSRVSAPKPAIGACQSSFNADEAVSNFFTSSYTIDTKTQKMATFKATDIDTTVTLKR